MSEPVTIPQQPSTSLRDPEPSSWISLPQDLLEKARGRMKLVALLCLLGSSIDVVNGLSPSMAVRISTPWAVSHIGC